MWSRLICAVLVGAVAASACSSDPEASPDPPGSPPVVENSTASTIPVPPVSTTAPPTSEPWDAAVQAERLEDELAEKLREYPAPGALALISVDGRRVFASSGTADVDGTPITPDTRFRIASITKPITAALVLDAVQRGELSLDDRVNDLVPGLLVDESPVTVRMLLDHTSGIFDETNNEEGILDDIALLTDEAQRAEAEDLRDRYFAGEPVIVPPRLLVALAEAHGRDFPPGTGYQYGNVNYQVAAIVLEQVTGQPFAELVRTRIVEPLGLEHTTVAPPDLAAPEFHGYGTDIDDGSLVDVTADLSLFGNGANGGVISTADELMTMMQAIVGGDFLDDALLADMRSPTELSSGTYGLGLAPYYLTCGDFSGHEGGVNGTASIAMVSADGSDAVVVALNLRDGSDPRMPAFGDSLLCPALDAAS